MSDELITLLGVVFVALLGLWWNFLNAKRLRKQPFLQKQLDLCIEASEIVAILATTDSRTTFDQARARFLALFWGPLSVVENDEISAAMIHYRKKLDKLTKEGRQLPLEDLEDDSYEIAKRVRKLILSSWKITDLAPELERD